MDTLRVAICLFRHDYLGHLPEGDAIVGGSLSWILIRIQFHPKEVSLIFPCEGNRFVAGILEPDF